jgi:hypothetical protein
MQVESGSLLLYAKRKNGEERKKRHYAQPSQAEIIMGIIWQGLSFIITPNKAYIHQNISCQSEYSGWQLKKHTIVKI